jgi:hypothetical protein
MTVLHSGTTKKFSENWAAAFGKGKKASTPAKTEKKASAKKKAKKK